MPAFELRVDPLGHRQHLVRRRHVVRPLAQLRRHGVPDDRAVESVAGDRHAVVAEDGRRPCPTRADGGSSASIEKSLVPPPKSPISTVAGSVSRC